MKAAPDMKDIYEMVWETVLENCIMRMEALMKGHGKTEKLKVSENFITNLGIWPIKVIGFKGNFMDRVK